MFPVKNMQVLVRKKILLLKKRCSCYRQGVWRQSPPLIMSWEFLAFCSSLPQLLKILQLIIMTLAAGFEPIKGKVQWKASIS